MWSARQGGSLCFVWKTEWNFSSFPSDLPGWLCGVSVTVPVCRFSAPKEGGGGFFAEKLRNELDNRRKRGYITGYSIENE